MEKWYSDFKELENIKTFDRSKWDDQRDLVIDSFDAMNHEHARVVAFEIAEKHLDRPYLGTLKKLGIEEKKEMKKGQKKPDISGPVLNFLQGRSGKSTSLDQLIKATGYEAGQIQGAISHYRLKGTNEIETLVRGKMWRWMEVENGQAEDTTKPEVTQQVEAYIESSNNVEPSDDEKGFYLLNTAKDGGLILQRDSDGTIWKAERL